MEKYIVFDIGGTAIKHGILTKTGEVIDQGQTPTEAHRGGENIVLKLKQMIELYLEKHQIEGVCISTAGMVNPKEGKVIYSGPTVPGYTGTKLKQIVEKAYGLPCEVENDVNCAALGEIFKGAAQGKSSIVCLTLGTGLGGAVVLNNEIVHGHTYAAGEIGYMLVNGQPIQDIASARALVESVCKRKGENPKTYTGYQVFEGYENGDPICVEEVKRLVDNLAVAITNITYMFNPEAVILGGGILARHEILFPLLNESLKKYMLPHLLESTLIAPAKLQNQAGMLGALYHYLTCHE